MCFGRLDSDGQLNRGTYLDMEWGGPGEEGSHAYTAAMTCQATGITGYTVRVMPRHGDIIDGRDLGMVHWA